MRDSKEVTNASAQREKHSGASAKHAQDAKVIDGAPESNVTTVDIPEQEQDSKANGKRFKVVAAALLTLGLLVAGGVSVLFYNRSRDTSEMVTQSAICSKDNIEPGTKLNVRLTVDTADDQILSITQFVNSCNLAKVNFASQSICDIIGCRSYYKKPKKDDYIGIKNLYALYKPINSSVFLDDTSSLPAESTKQLAWFKSHPFFAQQLYQMAKLFSSYPSNGGFSKEGYAKILGFEHLHTLLPPQVLTENTDANDALSGTLAQYRKNFYIDDLTKSEAVLPKHFSTQIEFVNILLRKILVFARYTFVVARWNAKDKDAFCSGEELNTALPKLFPCVPNEGKLGGSFADHLGRVSATYMIAQYHSKRDSQIDEYYVAPWVCGEFDPVTGTASLETVIKYYQYSPTADEQKNKSVAFKDFVKQNPDSKLT